MNDNLKVDQVFILSLVGFYLLPQGIFDLIRVLMSEYFSNNAPINNPFNTGSSHMVYVYITASLMKIIIALSLIFKTKGWAVLFKKIRYMGR